MANHISYQDWLQNRLCTEETVERLVLSTEEASRGPTEVVREKTVIMQRFKDLPFSSRVWGVYFANTFALTGVKRIDKRPYATHPTRMALSCYWLASNQLAEDSAVPALLHDYLEESGGISKASIVALNELLPGEPLAIPSAVLLSEPDISYKSLGREEEQSKLKRIAYIIQARDALKKGYPKALANASIVDKLDNLHDLGYLTREPDLEKRSRKIAQRIAFFQRTLLQVGPFGSASFQHMLSEAIAAKVSEFDIEALLNEELASLSSLAARSEDAIRAMVAQYHLDIGMNKDR